MQPSDSIVVDRGPDGEVSVRLKPKRQPLTRRDHWRLFKRDLRLAWWHLKSILGGK